MIEHLIPLKRHCEQHGVTLNQLTLLVCIEKEPKTLTALAGQLAVTTAAITGQIDALTTKGYLVTQTDLKDRRVKKATPTPAGLTLLQTAALSVAITPRRAAA